MSDAEQLGRLAKDLLDNEAFNKAFKILEERLKREWTRADDLGAREQAWGMVRLLEKVRWELEYLMTDGKQEQIYRKEQELIDDESEAQKKRKKEYFDTPLKGTRLEKLERTMKEVEVITSQQGEAS